MFWDRPWRKKKTYKYDLDSPKNRGYNFDWSSYGRPAGRKWSDSWEQVSPTRKRSAYSKILVAVCILAVLVAVRNWPSPFGEDVRAGLRYVLTTDWNFQPVVEKVVQLGLQLAGEENHFETGVPRINAYKETMGKTDETAGLPLPVSGKLVRSYGWSTDSIDNMERFHPGIDIAATPGSQVKAVLPGKVVKIGEEESLKNFILLDHGEGTYTLYAGLSNIKVLRGQTVAAGDVIGEVSNGGDAQERGLHFELREKNTLVDPLSRLETPPAE